jgi:hypothetical protein
VPAVATGTLDQLHEICERALNARALELMVGDGLLECHAATDGRKRYRLPASPGRMPAP